ncbi:MAG: hypothetical protein ABI831_04655 [Betaproteobacteria bacterium]
MKRARKSKAAKSLSKPVPLAAAADETVVVPVLAPRNPYVALVHQRKGGAHAESGRTRRQAEKRELRKQMERE